MADRIIFILPAMNPMNVINNTSKERQLIDTKVNFLAIGLRKMVVNNKICPNKGMMMNGCIASLGAENIFLNTCASN